MQFPTITLSSKNASRVSAAGKVDYWEVRNGPGVLLALFGYNAGAVAFIHIHDAVTGTLPADGATVVPLHTCAIGAADNYSVLIPVTGINFGRGLTIIVSSTPNLTTYAATKDVTMLVNLKG